MKRLGFVLLGLAVLAGCGASPTASTVAPPAPGLEWVTVGDFSRGGYRIEVLTACLPWGDRLYVVPSSSGASSVTVVPAIDRPCGPGFAPDQAPGYAR